MTANTKLERLLNAITDSLREMEESPNDCPVEIFNENLESWETELKMNHRFEIESIHPF